MNINQEYNSILNKCKFIAKPDAWFNEKTEVKMLDTDNYSEYSDTDKFNFGWCLFEGLTDETYEGYTGELPRLDEESCPLDEFFIYDQYGNEISELTLKEYKILLRKLKFKKLKFK